ncbi:MAG: GDP-mannose 4,6-dehydratase [Candidatus Aminicenantia bacterium]
MKIFITGLTGFVGQHLDRLLEENKYQVFGTSYPQKPPSQAKNVHYLDIREGKKLAKFIKEVKPDLIFHLAAISNVQSSWEKRQQTIETNILGTSNLLEAVRQFSPQSKILLVGSSDIYGNIASENQPISEEFPYNPINPYGVSKVAQEILGKFYHSIENLKVIMTRSFNHTGPGQSPEFVCSDWAKQIAEIERGQRKPVLKVGNLESKRDFTDVRDVARAYLLLLSKGKAGEIYNVCSSRAIFLKDILKTLLSYSQISIKVKVDHHKFRKTDFPLLVGDNRKLITQIGWQPEIPFEKTLLDLLNYWRNRVKNRN